VFRQLADKEFLQESEIVTERVRHLVGDIEVAIQPVRYMVLANVIDEAGCELQPQWANGALLLVPLTQEMLNEEACLAHSRWKLTDGGCPRLWPHVVGQQAPSQRHAGAVVAMPEQ
jgi:hypothetical protein